MDAFIIIITALAAFLVTQLSGYFIIPYLKKLKYGQTIKEIGPSWHKNKQGTPTMGGLMFIAGIVIAVFVGYISMYISSGAQAMNLIETTKLFAGLCMALAFAIMGYWDDYIKVAKKRNLGLTAKQKLLIQTIIAVGYLAALHFVGAISTIVDIPFIGQFNFGFMYYPFMVFLIVGFVNATNLTDGVDGLASSVTCVVGVAFFVFIQKLQIEYMGLLALALSTACIGFLIWNFHPAKVFMGDTGSMFLGGVVVSLAFGINMPLILLLVGIIYLIEAFSVILQVISFKTTGKRIFKMSPIHHHFEMSGYSENKIVALFSFVTAIFCAIAYFAVPVV